MLSGQTRSFIEPHPPHTEQHIGAEAEQSIPATGILKVSNKGEGFRSVGWRIAPDRVFDRTRLFSFLCGLDVERMKAVFITEDGVFGYNQAADALTEIELDDCLESRIEIICTNIKEHWELELLSCAVISE